MTVTADPTVAWTVTESGRKIHAVRDGETLCGSVVHQLVLVEWPLPEPSVCEWCRAALEKEDG